MIGFQTSFKMTITEIIATILHTGALFKKDLFFRERESSSGEGAERGGGTIDPK